MTALREQTAPSRKRILVAAYSQTGQLSRITERVLRPLRDDPLIDVHVEMLRPLRPFPFPWSILRFFDAFPESALMRPGEIETPSLNGDEQFDLVVIPYQVWFLAPSQPMVAFLRDERVRQVIAGRPVVTIIACRNMWLLAQEKMKQLLHEADARLIDNVVLTDRAPTLATLVTTPLWLLTGKRQSVHWLPPAGISDPDIERSIRFGRALRNALHSDRETGNGPLLDGLAAVDVQPQLLTSEKAGTRSFKAWGMLLHAAGKPGAVQRIPLLALYMLFLITLIVAVVPVSLLIQRILRPILKNRFAATKRLFEQPSGSGIERMSSYDF